MQHLYILKTGETFATTKARFGDFDRWVMNMTGERAVRTIDLLNGATLPRLESAKGFIITGSHAMVTENSDWSRELERYIRRIAARNIPLLGICYGHQLIAKALGGRSGYNPKGKEIGTVKIRRTPQAQNDPLFCNIPRHFSAYETHYQSALRLPPKAVVLAKNGHDAHQAVRFGESVWGVQFHPEFDRTIMAEYVVNQAAALLALGFDTQRLLDGLRRCDTSSRVLRNFMVYVNRIQ